MKASRFSFLPLLFIAIALMWQQPVHAQQYPLEVTVTLIPPYSPLLSDWEAHPERIQLLVRNTDVNNSYEFRLGGSIESEDKSMHIRSKDNADMRMFKIEAAGMLNLSGNDWNLFNQNQVVGSGVDRDMVARTGRLPEGEYTLCAQALDYTTRNPLSQPPPAGCMGMQIQYGEVPILLAPACGEPVELLQPQTMILQWTMPVAGVPPEELGNLRYELLLVPVPQGKTPETAIESPGDPPFFIARDLSSALYTYTADDPLLETGTTYAWRVRVYDLNERVAFRNGGKSEVCSIVFKAPDPVCFRLTPFTPANGSVLSAGLPRFSLEVDKPLNPVAIKGGRIRVWWTDTYMRGGRLFGNYRPSAWLKKEPGVLVFDYSFTGHSDREFLLKENSGKYLCDLRFLNHPGSDTSFVPEVNKRYKWESTLEFDNGSILTNGTRCIPASVTSKGGTFDNKATEGSLAADCTTPCEFSFPTGSELPSRQTDITARFKKGDTLKIGYFRLQILNVTANAGLLNGDGLIRVPFLNDILVPVIFSDIHAGMHGEVFSGRAEIVRLPEPLDPNKPVPSRTEALRAEHQRCSDPSRWVSRTHGQQVVLPVGFDNIVEGRRKVIAILGMTFEANRANVDAAIVEELPWLGTNAAIAFSGTCCMHPGGLDRGDAELPLAADAVFGSDSEMVYSFKGTGTKARWNCNGFKEFSANIGVAFPLEKFHAASDDGRSTNEKWEVTYQTDIGSLTDFILKSPAPMNFKCTDVHGIAFKVENLVWDNSTGQSSAVGLPSTLSDPSWRGFYAEKSFVIVPPITSFNSGTSWRCAGEKLYITTSGLLTASAEMTSGDTQHSLGGWGITPRQFHMKINEHNLTEGELTGGLLLPVSDKDVNFSFLLQRQTEENRWKFIHSADGWRPDTTGFTLWGCKAKWHIGEVTAEFQPGRKMWDVKDKVNYALLMFDGSYQNIGKLRTQFIARDLTLQNRHPYLSVGSWAYQDAMGDSERSWCWWYNNSFDIASVNLNPPLYEGDMGSDLDMRIRFPTILNIAIVIDGHFTFRGSVKTPSDRPHYSEHGTNIRRKTRFNSNLSIIFQVEGELDMFDSDPIYGSGWMGQVNMAVLGKFSFAGMLCVGKTADMTFVGGLGPTGTTEEIPGFRYWYADARLMLSDGMMPVTQSVWLYGITGGLWWKMSISDTTKSLKFPIDNAIIHTAPIGTGLSGCKYVPNETASLGMKLILTFAAPEPVPIIPKFAIFNAGFDVTFSTAGGVSRCGLLGEIYLLTWLDQMNSAPFKAQLRGAFTNNFKYFSGSLTVNTGLPMVSQSFWGKELGSCSFSLNPGEWSAKLGTPSNPLSLNLADNLTASGYLMMGNEALPAPTAAGCRAVTRSGAELVASGQGVAFGVAVGLDTGERSLGVGAATVYGRAQGQVKADAAMMHRGNVCNRNPVGIAGWYASGNLVLSLTGTIRASWPDIPNPVPQYLCNCCLLCCCKRVWPGVKVCGPCCKSWCNSPPLFYGGSTTLWTGGICESVSFGGPNPLWFEYTKEYQVNLLGGRINQTVGIPLHFGSKCNL